MAKPTEPDDLIANLTPAQLDALNARLDARRAEIGAQPVFCRHCAGVGIEWHPGYGDTSDLAYCRTCRGQGAVPRRQAGADTRDWDVLAALAATLQSVAHNEYRLQVAKSGNAWKLTQSKSAGGPYEATVTPVPGTLADFDLVIAAATDRAEPGTYRLAGTGALWHAIHYTCRGLPVDYRPRY